MTLHLTRSINRIIYYTCYINLTKKERKAKDKKLHRAFKFLFPSKLRCNNVDGDARDARVLES